MRARAGRRFVHVLLPALALLGACKEAPPPPDGAALFGSACARCHGKDGRGGLAAPGHNPPRDLSAPAWQDGVTDEQIRRIVREGSGAMPPFKDVLEGAQVDAVVAHLRTLRAAQASTR